MTNKFYFDDDDDDEVLRSTVRPGVFSLVFSSRLVLSVPYNSAATQSSAISNRSFLAAVRESRSFLGMVQVKKVPLNPGSHPTSPLLSGLREQCSAGGCDGRRSSSEHVLTTPLCPELLSNADAIICWLCP